MYTGIRVGNEKSATGYKSLRDKKVKQTYGLTTLKKEHVQFDKDGVLLKFQGKRDVEQNIRIKEANMVALVKHFYDRSEKGEEIIPATPYEIAKYVKKTVGKEYTPKDLRMIRANREALVHMNRIRKKPKRETKGEVNADINEVLDKVSAALGNTRGVAKRSYVSEFLLEEFKSARLKPKKKKVKKK
jgi:DNA topoisomerase-1